MTVFIALLRAVNVGGTGKLPMDDLRAMCADLGFENVSTYIASGNVVFQSDKDEAGVKAALEKRLAEYAGKPVGVLVRIAGQMRRVLEDTPFPKAPGNRVTVTFLDAPPSADALDAITGQADEEAALGTREIYIHYPSGMGRSKLSIKAVKAGTARNMNTVAKLVDMAEALEGPR